jgi:hypothetical protein
MRGVAERCRRRITMQLGEGWADIDVVRVHPDWQLWANHSLLRAAEDLLIPPDHRITDTTVLAFRSYCQAREYLGRNGGHFPPGLSDDMHDVKNAIEACISHPGEV